MAQYAFYFDSNKVSGCKTPGGVQGNPLKLPVNNLYPQGAQLLRAAPWNSTNWRGSYIAQRRVRLLLSPWRANHCVDPAGVANCPTGAMQKDEETWHRVDRSRGVHRLQDVL